MGYGRQYTDEEKQFILDNYKGISTRELTERFNSYFNLNIKESSLKAYKKFLVKKGIYKKAKIKK